MSKKRLTTIIIVLIIVIIIVGGIGSYLYIKQGHLSSKEDYSQCEKIGGEVFCGNGWCMCSYPHEECYSNTDCNDDKRDSKYEKHYTTEFCSYSDGKCNGPGKCLPISTNVIAGSEAPKECGCDNKTYNNSIDREKAGVSLKYIGECANIEDFILYPCKQSNKKYGFCDKITDKLIVPAIYDGAYVFSSDGFARVLINGRYGFIDKTGKLVIPAIYDTYGTKDFFEGLAVVNINSKYGFIDKTGKLVIPAIYDDAWSFSHDGLARILLNGKVGYIDKTGKLIIPAIYNSGGNFSKGFADVELNNKRYCINTKGKIIKEGECNN